MYENNNNYSQQSNNAGSTGNGYPEYYYSTGAPNINYEQTQRPPVDAPKIKQKKLLIIFKFLFCINCLDKKQKPSSFSLFLKFVFSESLILFIKRLHTPSTSLIYSLKTICNFSSIKIYPRNFHKTNYIS